MSDLHTIYIDNMVCDRCISAVKRTADGLGYRIKSLSLGRLTGWPPPEDTDLSRLAGQLETQGFRLLENAGVISRIKGLIIEYVYDDRADDDVRLSDLISRDVGMSYSHLSRLFSAREGRTIEQFYGLHRTERAKRLLHNTDAMVSQIAYRLHYGSGGRFAAAFRAATGMSPSEFRRRGEYEPIPLDEV